MDENLIPENLVRFGVFEVDLASGELRKSGVRLRLGGQPFQVLAFLLKNPGKLVKREELKQELWADDTFVDFENGVNTAIRKIRRVLDDSADTPRYVETLPRRGYRFIGPVEGRPQGVASLPHPASPSPVAPWKAWLPWALFAVTALAAVLGIAFMYFSEAPVQRSLRKWSFTPEGLSGDVRPVAVSPNGKHIAYVAGPGAPRLWVRDVDRLEPRELAGTEISYPFGPFWSPDSRFLGFYAGGEVKKISVQGGPAITLCPSPGAFHGGAWSPDGESVVFGADFPPRIFEVPVRGGQAKLLFEPESTAKGSRNMDPHFLPQEAAARSMLLNVGGNPALRDIFLKNLETGASLVLAEGRDPAFSPTGHVIYQLQGGLWALPFSPDALKPTGEAFSIVEDGGSPSVADDGTLVSVGRGGIGLRQLVWRDRAGVKLGEIGQPQRALRFPVLSPDGRRVAVTASETGNQDVWLHEVARPMKRRMTFDPVYEGRPQWSPSGREILFQSRREGTHDIFRRAVDGPDDAKVLFGTEARESPWGWSRDGNYLVYTAESAGKLDLWYLKRNDDADGFESVPFLVTPFDENAPNLSPDGRFLAYCSDMSGEDQVYVRPFPSGDTQSQVSANGGCQPRWSRDGTELFYVEGDTLMAVKATTSPALVAVSATPLFSDPHLSVRSSYQVAYDVSADGRFVLTDSVEGAEAAPASINVVENWYEEFRGRSQN